MDNKDTPLPVEQNISTASKTNKVPDTSSTLSLDTPVAPEATTSDCHEPESAGSTQQSKIQEACNKYIPLARSNPTLPWAQEDFQSGATASLAAPYISNADASHLTEPQLIVGVYINIPRSPKLWAGDQLKLTWGYNTFYCTITEPKDRKGPRLIQYLNSEKLAHYKDGEVYVYYEVVRGNKLVGVSEKLKVTLSGIPKGRARNPNRRHGIRRRKLPF
jgi:hypothetical protein